jgi:hypothetical protein
MKTINRQQFIAEQVIRAHIQKRIKNSVQERTNQEQIVRKFIRTLIEAETGTEEPSTFTGINVLADTLERIIPVLQDDYKMLTTSLEQRESFRNHIVHAVKNALKPIEVATDAEDTPTTSENQSFNLDRKILEKIKIDLDSEDDMVDPETVEGEFIDIATTDQDDFVEIDDQNETGRNFAATTFKKVEKQIVDSYDMLADEEDQKLFYDYLITNLLLYFDKFEDELTPSLPDTTTPEYEEEKGQSPETEENPEEETEDLI